MSIQEEVLSLLRRHLPGRQLRPSGGGNVLTTCPFHKEGRERKPSFSVNVMKGVYHCFTCHVGGDIRKLLEELGLPRERVDSETAIIKPTLDRNREMMKIERDHTFVSHNAFAAPYPLPEALLGVYDFVPEKLIKAGFDAQLLKECEIGYDKRLERITFPIRDMFGTLAGISGGATRKDQEPKYKVYQGGRKDGAGHWIEGQFGPMFDEQYPGYTCENKNYLWNYHRIWWELLSMSDPSARLYIVEGFKACLWMVQNGYWNTVALMGSSMSYLQSTLIHRFGGTVVLALDNDTAGRLGTLKIGDALWEPCRSKILVANYPSQDDSTQPDDYHADGLHDVMQRNLRFDEFVNLQTQRGELWQQ